MRRRGVDAFEKYLLELHVIELEKTASPMFQVRARARLAQMHGQMSNVRKVDKIVGFLLAHGETGRAAHSPVTEVLPKHFQMATRGRICGYDILKV